MNKKLTAFMLAGASLLGMGLTSCQNEDFANQDSTQAKEKVFVTIEANIDTEGSRSTLDAAPYSLKFGWVKGDRIEVVNSATGEQIGYLYAEEPADPDAPGKCNLSGQIEKISGQCTLNFYYLGSGDKKLPLNKENGKYFAGDYAYNFAAQDGTSDKLNENDLLIAQKTFQNGTGGSLGTISFNHHFSVGRFRLVYNDTPLTFSEGTKVTIGSASAEGKFYNASTLKPGSFDTYDSTKGSIVVTTATNDFYVYLIPSDNVTKKFTCTVDGKEFVGTSGTKISSGKFYTGNDAPIDIIMERSDGSDKEYTWTVTWKDGYTDDPIKVKNDYKGKANTIDITEDYPADPSRDGFEFKGWAPQIEKLTSDNFDVVITAQWEQIKHSVKIKWLDDEGTTIKSMEPDVPHGETVYLESPNPLEKDGFEFLGWVNKDTGERAPESIIVEEEISWIFVPSWKEYTISITDYGHGDFNP